MTQRLPVPLAPETWLFLALGGLAMAALPPGPFLQALQGRPQGARLPA